VSHGLPYDEARFHLVNCGFMAGGIRDWPALIREIHRVVVATGDGWIQIAEFRPWLYCDDDSIPPNAPSIAWTNLLFGQTKIGRRLGTSSFDEIATSLKGWVQAAGFVDVTEHINKARVGGWHDEDDSEEDDARFIDRIGRCMAYSWGGFLEALKPELWRRGGR